MTFERASDPISYGEVIPADTWEQFLEASGDLSCEWQGLREAVFRTLGGASVCWSKMHDAGVFDSEQATRYGEGLISWIEKRYEPNAENHLKDLITELLDNFHAYTGAFECNGGYGPGGEDLEERMRLAVDWRRKS